MSSNIYEDPHLTMNVKYSREAAREDGGEKVERRVDIYESVNSDQHVYMQHREAHPQRRRPPVQRKPLKAAALVLGLLCLLLTVGLIVLLKLNFSITVEKDRLQTRTEELQTSYDNLSNSICQETQGGISEWKRFQCSCYYKSTEMKNWTESRTDCQKRGADLVVVHSKEEDDFVRKLNDDEASWIGLRSVKVDRDWDWRWEWVDGSTPTYQSWPVSESINPEGGATQYVYLQKRLWKPTNNGSKQWICERHLSPP